MAALRERSDPARSDPSTHVVVGQEHHPSALRNRIPILKVLLRELPSDLSGPALEVATGTAAFLEVLAPAFPELVFQPSEYVPEVAASPEEQWTKHGKIGLRQGCDELANIDAHCASVFPNCLPAVALDLLEEPWPGVVTGKNGRFALVVCNNTLHITPWACSAKLFAGAAKALRPGGFLVTYGPFKMDGKFVGDDGGAGNERFDAKLRSVNADWGLRDVGDLEKLAKGNGLELRTAAPMPANNYTLVFVRS